MNVYSITISIIHENGTWKDTAVCPSGKWVILWNCVSLNHCIWQVQGLTKVLEHSQDVLMPKGVILWFYTFTHLSLIHVIALNYVNCILLAAKLSRNVGLQTQ